MVEVTLTLLAEFSVIIQGEGKQTFTSFSDIEKLFADKKIHPVDLKDAVVADIDAVRVELLALAC